jgi:hypothetical protein
MPDARHRSPFEPRSGFDVRIAFADQNSSDRRNIIDDRNVDLLLNGTSSPGTASIVEPAPAMTTWTLCLVL